MHVIEVIGSLQAEFRWYGSGSVPQAGFPAKDMENAWMHYWANLLWKAAELDCIVCQSPRHIAGVGDIQSSLPKEICPAIQPCYTFKVELKGIGPLWFRNQLNKLDCACTGPFSFSVYNIYKPRDLELFHHTGIAWMHYRVNLLWKAA
ncbi:hypothetical protein V6N11_032552 [Hibiscus sabdariffa]|uniref:Uncharacterized protein n=1 Tax=Hibiscus sabdariffa TaxID=183260 RepID=A0ABR2T109_9ROSI